MKKKVCKSKWKYVVVIALCLWGAYEYKLHDSFNILEHRIYNNLYQNNPQGKDIAHCVAKAFKSRMGGLKVISAVDDWYDFLSTLTQEETSALMYNLNKCEMYYQN